MFVVVVLISSDYVFHNQVYMFQNNESKHNRVDSMSGILDSQPL